MDLLELTCSKFEFWVKRFSIFVRHGKRIVGLTEAGRELAPLVQRILFDLKNIRSIAFHFSRQDVGRLTVAATHA